MKILPLSLAASFIFVSAIGYSQTLPPPAFAGQSYWFGPGPSAMSVVSSGQTDGGYAEMYQSPAWTASGGGPALLSTSAGTNATASFLSQTTLTISPYIYVDGYFSVVATATGFGGGTVNVGTSRFFVLHNTPVELILNGFTNLGSGSFGVAPTLQTTYHFDFIDYTNPANFTDSTDIIAADLGAGSFTTLIDNIQDEGILQVDVSRSSAVPAGISAGQYVGQGVIHVLSV